MVQLRQCTIVLHERQCVPNAPINGMPHLAYLGQILEKGGKFAVIIFPERSVLSRDCPNPLAATVCCSFS